MEDGDETKKILDPAVEVVAHCVRIPVFIGHSEAVLSKPKSLSMRRLRDHLRAADGVVVIDHRADEGYVTPKICRRRCCLCLAYPQGPDR